MQTNQQPFRRGDWHLHTLPNYNRGRAVINGDITPQLTASEYFISPGTLEIARVLDEAY